MQPKKAELIRVLEHGIVFGVCNTSMWDGINSLARLTFCLMYVNGMIKLEAFPNNPSNAYKMIFSTIAVTLIANYMLYSFA